MPEGMGAITLVIATKGTLRGRTPKFRQDQPLYPKPEKKYYLCPVAKWSSNRPVMKPGVR